MGQSAVQPDSQTDNFFSILLSLEFCIRILIVNLCSTLQFHIKNMMWLVFKQPKHRPFCRTMFFHVSGSVTTAHLIDGWGPLQKAHHNCLAVVLLRLKTTLMKREISWFDRVEIQIRHLSYPSPPTLTSVLKQVPASTFPVFVILPPRISSPCLSPIRHTTT